MAGVNDAVFRAICRRMGAALTYTEMISSKGLAFGNAKTQEMIGGLPEDRPYAVQLFGNEPAVMAAEAHALAQKLGNNLALIDLNMGCPARKVASQGSGASLLQKPLLARHIVKAVSEAVSVPVTVKMRLLSASEDASTLAFALMVEEAGAAAVTLHGRTAEQLYRGEARRDITEQVASQLSIPLIASGDVFSHEDVREYRERGAFAVMAARGARGNPWLFAHRQPSLADICAVAREHTVRLFELEPHKLVWMRKHFAWYFKGTPGAVHVRTAVQSAVTLTDYLTILDEHAQ